LLWTHLDLPSRTIESGNRRLRLGEPLRTAAATEGEALALVIQTRARGGWAFQRVLQALALPRAVFYAWQRRAQGQAQVNRVSYRPQMLSGSTISSRWPTASMSPFRPKFVTSRQLASGQTSTNLNATMQVVLDPILGLSPISTLMGEMCRTNAEREF